MVAIVASHSASLVACADGEIAWDALFGGDGALRQPRGGHAFRSDDSLFDVAHRGEVFFELVPVVVADPAAQASRVLADGIEDYFKQQGVGRRSSSNPLRFVPQLFQLGDDALSLVALNFDATVFDRASGPASLFENAR